MISSIRQTFGEVATVENNIPEVNGNSFIILGIKLLGALSYWKAFRKIRKMVMKRFVECIPRSNCHFFPGAWCGYLSLQWTKWQGCNPNILTGGRSLRNVPDNSDLFHQNGTSRVCKLHWTTRMLIPFVVFLRQAAGHWIKCHGYFRHMLYRIRCWFQR